jgi:hypothetical protein
MGVQPSETWRAGEPTSLPGIRKKTNGWRLSSPLADTSNLEPHLRWLLEHLPAKALPGKAQEWGLVFSCSITTSDAAPAITIPAEVSAGLARLGAELDIDLIVRSA